MNLLVIVLAIIIAIMLLGGIWFYVKIFKNIVKEFTEFVQVTFEALKDRKLTVVEKEKMLKEWADLRPYTSQLKRKFVDDVKDIAEDIKELYQKIKETVKVKPKAKATPKVKKK